MIIFHNLLDGVNPADWGDLQWLWRILHVGDQMPYTSQWLDSLQGWLNGKPFDAPQPRVFNPFYPLIPWIGVMAAGYGFGSLMLLEQRRRRRELLGLGISLVLLFVALRYTNFYGDKITNQPGQPGPWSVQEDWRFTVFSFVNCQKYPPSLLFLLMTIGPAIIGISHFDRENGPIGQFFVIFGRVPLFFYLLHWFLIKGLAIGFAYARFGRADWLYGVPSNQQGPEGSRYDLWVVYLVWVGVVLFLFPLCYWFAGVKRRSKAAWLSYL